MSLVTITWTESESLYHITFKLQKAYLRKCLQLFSASLLHLFGHSDLNALEIADLMLNFIVEDTSVLCTVNFSDYFSVKSLFHFPQSRISSMTVIINI